MPTLDPYVRSKQNEKHARVCPVCGETFVTNVHNKICCSRTCTEKKWRWSNPESLRLISAKTVREEEGLQDKPKSKHVCRFYPPYSVCVCGKHQPAARVGGD
jgi:hypothetical protein